MRLKNYNHEVAKEIYKLVSDIYKVDMTNTSIRTGDYKSSRYTYYLLCKQAGLSVYNMTEASGMRRNSLSTCDKHSDNIITGSIKREGCIYLHHKCLEAVDNLTIKINII